MHSCNPSTREAKKSITCLRSTRSIYYDSTPRGEREREKETDRPSTSSTPWGNKKTPPTLHSWNTFQQRRQIRLQSEEVLCHLPPMLSLHSSFLPLQSLLFIPSTQPRNKRLSNSNQKKTQEQTVIQPAPLPWHSDLLLSPKPFSIQP